MGEFEASDFLSDRTSKGAPFVAEQFALEKAGGNCGAVEFNERFIAARTQFMDSAGN
jgi:hypothetical protein